MLSRVFSMTGKYFDSKVPKSDKKDNLVAGRIEEAWQEYEKDFKLLDLKRALEQVAQLAAFANKYVEDTKPWILAKQDQDRLKDVVYNLLELVRHIGLMLVPYLPETAEKILSNMSIDVNKVEYLKAKEWGVLEEGTRIALAPNHNDLLT